MIENGRPIAANEQTYRVVLKPEDVEDLEDTFARLSRLIPVTSDDLEKVRREIRRSAPGTSITVLDRLSWEDIAEVAVNGPALPGVAPEVGLSRVYPNLGDFAHVVGYVGPSVTTTSQKSRTQIRFCSRRASRSVAWVSKRRWKRSCGARPGTSKSKSTPGAA